jgi:serine/threonine protein kinase
MPFLNRRCVQRYAKDSTELSFQPLVDKDVTSAAVMFVESLLSVSPRDRPSAKDALQLPWMMNDASNSLRASPTTILTEPMLNPLPIRRASIQVAPANRPKIPEDIEGTIHASSSLNSQTIISPATSKSNKPDTKGQSARMYITSVPYCSEILTGKGTAISNSEARRPPSSNDLLHERSFLTARSTLSQEHEPAIAKARNPNISDGRTALPSP